MAERHRALLVGFGRVAAGYADDPIIARRIPFASHVQVLRAHPAFEWVATIDPSPERRASAEQQWGSPATAADLAEFPGPETVEVAVLATPPDVRLGVIEALPSLKAVLVEKPLGQTYDDAKVFVDRCAARRILVQVNLTRRSDACMQELAGGGLTERIGRAQAAFGVYGNGVANNGTHMVDLVRMLLGEITAVRAIQPEAAFAGGPLPGDVNVAFALMLNDGVCVFWQPLRFGHYRECHLDVWGERGRVQIVHEGLDLVEYPVGPSRALHGAREITAERARISSTGYGDALYRMYDNLHAALLGKDSLVSSGESALETERVIVGVMTSLRQQGALVHLARPLPPA